MNDLLGHEITAKEEFEIARVGKRKNMKARGYAGTPGQGPQGETCKTCVHSYKRSVSYWKCDLIKPTAGPGTDIRIKSPACQRWENKP